MIPEDLRRQLDDVRGERLRWSTTFHGDLAKADHIFDHLVLPFQAALDNADELLGGLSVRSVHNVFYRPALQSSAIVLSVVLDDGRQAMVKLGAPATQSAAMRNWEAAGCQVPTVLGNDAREVTSSTFDGLDPVELHSFAMTRIPGRSLEASLTREAISDETLRAVIRDLAKDLSGGHGTPRLDDARSDLSIAPFVPALLASSRAADAIFPKGWRDWLDRLVTTPWHLVSSHADVAPKQVLVAATSGKYRGLLDVGGKSYSRYYDAARLVTDIPRPGRLAEMTQVVLQGYAGLDERALDLWVAGVLITKASHIASVGSSTLVNYYGQLLKEAALLVERGPELRIALPDLSSETRAAER